MVSLTLFFGTHTTNSLSSPFVLHVELSLCFAEVSNYDPLRCEINRPELGWRRWHFDKAPPKSFGVCPFAVVGLASTTIRYHLLSITPLILRLYRYNSLPCWLPISYNYRVP